MKLTAKKRIHVLSRLYLFEWGIDADHEWPTTPTEKKPNARFGILVVESQHPTVSKRNSRNEEHMAQRRNLYLTFEHDDDSGEIEGDNIKALPENWCDASVFFERTKTTSTTPTPKICCWIRRRRSKSIHRSSHCAREKWKKKTQQHRTQGVVDTWKSGMRAKYPTAPRPYSYPFIICYPLPLAPSSSPFSWQYVYFCATSLGRKHSTCQMLLPHRTIPFRECRINTHKACIALAWMAQK